MKDEGGNARLGCLYILAYEMDKRSNSSKNKIKNKKIYGEAPKCY